MVRSDVARDAAPRPDTRRVLGIDLATEPAMTGAVVLDLQRGVVIARTVSGRLDDDRLVELAGGADIVGVDAPLGWPDAFVDAIVDHRELRPWSTTTDPAAQRRQLSKRVTDESVRRAVGLTPLSVSADRIGACAMRAARLQTLFARAWGTPAPRDGSGRIAEVYPAAALKVWALPHRGYKGTKGRGARREILDGMRAQAPWLDLAEVAEGCLGSDDELDAVISALVALAVRLGATTLPGTPAEVGATRSEGWIHVPGVPLAELGASLG